MIDYDYLFIFSANAFITGGTARGSVNNSNDR